MAPSNIYAQGLDMDYLSPRNIRSKGSGTIYTSPYSSQSFRRRNSLGASIQVFDSSRGSTATARGKTAAPTARDSLHSSITNQAHQKKVFIGKDQEPAIGCRVLLCDEVMNGLHNLLVLLWT